jgi:Na+/H+-translocating membrane pyrophosphatase
LARSLGKPFGIRSAQIAAVRLFAKDRIIMRYVAHNGRAFNHPRCLTAISLAAVVILGACGK